MAAVSSRPTHVAAAGNGGDAGHSPSNAASNREIRHINTNVSSKNDEGESSDAYSLEARSDSSNIIDHVGASAGDSAGGESVRPDSLTLTSPLEQLTRSLNFNKKDTHPLSTHATSRSRNKAGQQGSNDAAFPPVDQVMREYLAAEATHEHGASRFGESNNSTTGAHSSSSAIDRENRDQRNISESTAFEPVRFSDDTARTGGAEDVSDGQSQLINAFRSSYHTYMTRSGGLRDSSYSWMAPDADSPNMTMDFKQVEGHLDAANNKGDPTDLGRYDDHEEDDAVQEHDNEESGEWTLGDKVKARASSWDSQAAEKMELHRIPSQKSSKTPADGRTSDFSVLEPFHYSVSWTRFC